MLPLLAQFLPGYQTDVESRGGGPSTMFNNFYNFFHPNIFGSSLGYLVSRILLFVIVAAGLIFFFKLIASGFSYMTSAGDSAKIQSAHKNLVNALIGLLVVISAFFLAQIIQVVSGITIL